MLIIVYHVLCLIRFVLSLTQQRKQITCYHLLGTCPRQHALQIKVSTCPYLSIHYELSKMNYPKNVKNRVAN
jgi:hypothetical protein